MSEIRATTISNAAGTGPITMTGQYAAKAWSDTLGYPNTTTQYSVAHWENNGKQDIVYISGQINGDLA
jgi:enamine deaminase RidA (YjgF/YER057c/UK114 family)